MRELRARVGAAVDSLRRPAYTGANRRRTCTVLDAALAGLMALAVGVVSVPAGLAVAALAATGIYLRGYLVPGTSELTRRYVPGWVHDSLGTPDARAGGVETARGVEAAPESGTGESGALDGEAVLLDAGVLVPVDGGADLALDPAFEAAWRTRVEATDDDGARRGLAAMLGVEPAAVGIVRADDALVAWYDTHLLGQWASRTALRADVAAHEEFRLWDRSWDEHPLPVRSDLLGLCRFFLDRCPSCDGTVHVGEDTVTTCYRTVRVLVTTCEGCGDRLFAAPYDGAALPGIGDAVTGQPRAVDPGGDRSRPTAGTTGSGDHAAAGNPDPGSTEGQSDGRDGPPEDGP